MSTHPSTSTGRLVGTYLYRSYTDLWCTCTVLVLYEYRRKFSFIYNLTVHYITSSRLPVLVPVRYATRSTPVLSTAFLPRYYSTYVRT